MFRHAQIQKTTTKKKNKKKKTKKKKQTNKKKKNMKYGTRLNSVKDHKTFKHDKG